MQNLEKKKKNKTKLQKDLDLINIIPVTNKKDLKKRYKDIDKILEKTTPI
jgi:hypothetical protein